MELNKSALISGIVWKCKQKQISSHSHVPAARKARGTLCFSEATEGCAPSYSGFADRRVSCLRHVAVIIFLLKALLLSAGFFLLDQSQIG